VVEELSGRKIATVPVGDAPGWAELADHDRVCLIANTRSDDLSFVSVAQRKELARLKVGDGPKHITVARVPTDVLAKLRRSAGQDVEGGCGQLRSRLAPSGEELREAR
jgi:hypothetical protein